MISPLQELLGELKQKEPTLEKITIRYTRLSPEGTSLADQNVTPLREKWEGVVSQLERHLQGRKDFLASCQQYHAKHVQVDSAIDALAQQVDAVHGADDVPLQERIDKLKVRGVSSKQHR